MTSIMTNAAAMAALQTLRMIDRNLETTQGRVSSGYRVETAADNAAYWSISTTMRSDNSALSAVQDALGLGAAKVDTAYEALESAIEVVKEIKKKLVAAYSVGADRVKIQEEMQQLQEQLKSISESASFSGENWLQERIGNSGTLPAEEPIVKKIVASFIRTSSGGVEVTTVDYSLDSKTVLFDLSGGKFGILDKEAIFVGPNEAQVNVKVTAGTTTTTTGYVVEKLNDTQIAALNAATPDTNTDPNIYSDGTDTYYQVATNSWVKMAGTPSTGAGTEVAYTDGSGTDWYYDIGATPVLATDRSLSFSVTTLNINELNSVAGVMNGMVTGGSYTDAEALDVMVQFVNTQLEAMTSAASSLGSLQSRISMQDDFVSALMDVIDKGIGRLVDADMNEESTRLKALQTQQQLGIQSLSIANSNAENILMLFK
ncbi:flagellar protein FlaD [Rhizobium sp. CG4]|jgi:flagellin|uniref:flagellin N-terminal helical domain-containing protein n=1 Tax=unclassified Rhizobium TaxID=2613769 RepID=UPI0020334609|nr:MULTISPECIES: flagellin [unclassified Rhizobium]MCM2456232.1 flagellar protein FlaD [Rhizobium sp. CG4]MCS4243471.1 flagellin [Rhizobium sp. BIGb0125]